MSELLPHQQRVVDERKELNERRRKLMDFMATPTYQELSQEEICLLVKQAKAMRQYSEILGARLALWGVPL